MPGPCADEFRRSSAQFFRGSAAYPRVPVCALSSRDSIVQPPTTDTDRRQRQPLRVYLLAAVVVRRKSGTSEGGFRPVEFQNHIESVERFPGGAAKRSSADA